MRKLRASKCRHLLMRPFIRKKGEMSLKLAEEKERQLVDSMCNFATRVLAGEHKDEAELAILPEIAKILLNYCSFSIWRQ